MTLPATKNITIYQGDTFVFPFRVKTRSGINTVPVDLTGASAQAQIRAKDGTILAEFAAEITDPLEGQVRLTLSNTQTAALTQKGIWDCQIIRADGTVKTYLAGQVSLAKEVTRV